MTASRTPESWRRVNEIFHRVVALPDVDRAAAVAAACPDDAALRAEILSLLAAHDRADRFIEPRGGASHPPGTIIGSYRIERPIGRGGMGVVYRAFDVRLGRAVALKAIESDIAGDPRRRERLRREAKAAAAISHPNVATVYALEEAADEVFIASEFVEGDTLRTEIARGASPALAVVDTAIQLAEALEAAHACGVVHRDLKPENVMRTPRGRIKVLDFGLAIQTAGAAGDTRLTLEGTILGTPAYMSPEQIRGEPLDSRSDLFALGIVLYELLTGRHPFTAVDAPATIARILESDPREPTRAGDGADGGAAFAALATVIGRCLVKSREERIGSAGEVVLRLREAVSDAAARAGAMPGDPAPVPEPRVPRGQVTPARDAVWWWGFHQTAAIAGYAVLLLPLALTAPALGERASLWLGLAGFVPAVAASVLRLHLWFAWRSLPREWPRQRRRTASWLRFADVAFAMVLAAAGIAVSETMPVVGVLLIGASVCVLIASLVVEPATIRAAFPDEAGS